MRIEQLSLKNFKAYRDTAIRRLPAFCVFVGANGVGKSTLFDVFRFLKDCLASNVTKALQRRGGFKEVISRSCDLLQDTIQIEIKYRLRLQDKDRLVTYHLEIGQKENGGAVVRREILSYRRGNHGKPYNFLDFQDGSGSAITNELAIINGVSEETSLQVQREDQSLGAGDILALKGLGQLKKFEAANAFRQVIENWHVSDFHISSARGGRDGVGDDEHLSEFGDNLALVAQNLKENHPGVFAKVIESMKRRVPGIGDITTDVTADGRLLLCFRDGSFKDPFIDKFVSDGTIKMFAYLVLLYDPTPYPFLCIEEPENQLYTKLLPELVEEFRDYARRGGQVMVSTHSPEFLDATVLDEVFWLEKEQGRTKVVRAADDEQVAAYMKAGDSMGRLWSEGLLGKADPQ